MNPDDSGWSELERNIEAVIGACHLRTDPADWAQPTADRTLFADDDLRLQVARCRCGQQYFAVYRRVPRGSWNILVPITELDRRRLDTRFEAPAPNSWPRAEQAVVELTGSRPYIERTTDPPAACRWSAPGTPLAFTISPW